MAIITIQPSGSDVEFEAWVDGAPTDALPAELRLRALDAIHERLLIGIHNDVPEVASWATPLDAWRMLHWLYRGQMTIRSPDIDLAALRPLNPMLDY